jgi:hypothetical protein
MNDKFDPTTNRVPFGLLTEQERNVLAEWQHGIEFYNSGGFGGDQGWYDTNTYRWYDTNTSGWNSETVYRGKPAPVVTSERFNIYPWGPADSYFVSPSRRIAVLRIDTCNGVSTAHLEEV